ASPRPGRWHGLAAGAAGAAALSGVVVAALIIANGRPTTEAPRSASVGERPAMLAAPASGVPPSTAMARAPAPPAQADALPEPDASDPITLFAAAQMAPHAEPGAPRLAPFDAANAAPAGPLLAPPIAIDAAFADALPEPEVARPDRLAAMMRAAPSPATDGSRPVLPVPVALHAPAALHQAGFTPPNGDVARIAPPPLPIAAPPPPPPDDADTARIAPLPEPAALHFGQRTPHAADVLPIAPRLLPITLAGIDIAHPMQLPVRVAPPPAQPAPAVADTARVAPLPEPDTARLSPLAPVVADAARGAPAVAEVIDVVPQSEPATLQLAQRNSTGADIPPVAPVPEPDAARLPPLAPPVSPGADAARSAPMPEPGTPRIAQSAPGDAGPAQAAPPAEPPAP
ncbi:hypothetical protein GXW71_34620, partial [Roseomonas hellenica]|nr:hypothetical protein [Plastoroseomonas hellenica]